MDRETIVYERWFFRTWHGWPEEKVAERLGMTWEAYSLALRKARRAGDPRAQDWPSGVAALLDGVEVWAA